MGNKLYVGNLAYGVRDEELNDAFSQFGAVQSAKVMMDRETGRSKGFGFVAPTEGGKDVFVHATALQRAGVMQLAEGQTIQMEVVQGAKGPEATSITVD